VRRPRTAAGTRADRVHLGAEGGQNEHRPSERPPPRASCVSHSGSRALRIRFLAGRSPSTGVRNTPGQTSDQRRPGGIRTPPNESYARASNLSGQQEAPRRAPGLLASDRAGASESDAWPVPRYCMEPTGVRDAVNHPRRAVGSHCTTVLGEPNRQQRHPEDCPIVVSRLCSRCCRRTARTSGPPAPLELVGPG
jgi:hypothetical protein